MKGRNVQLLAISVYSRCGARGAVFRVIVNEQINVVFSLKTTRTRNTQKRNAVFGWYRKRLYRYIYS